VKPQIVCVGGGITGAFAAYFLVRQGAEVTIIERDRIGAHASGHNPGGLNPLHGPGIPGPLKDLALESMRLHLESWEDIRRFSGVDFGGCMVTRLRLAMSARDEAELAAAQALHDATPGFSARALSASELRSVEPRVCPDAIGGLWTEGSARVDAGPYTRAVSKAAVELGARIAHGEVRDLRHRGRRVTGVVSDSGTVECDGVVIAPGAWCAAPARWLGIKLAVEPVKGELLLAQTNIPPPQTEITWHEFGVYPARAGALWLGGTEDRVGFDASPSSTARKRILDGIQRMLPSIGRLRVVRQVAGLRPVTPDGLPILGISARWENVCLATGAGRKGMLLGAALGLAASELVVGGTTGLPIAACDLGRPGARG
jgi:glycine oxidase